MKQLYVLEEHDSNLIVLNQNNQIESRLDKLKELRKQIDLQIEFFTNYPDVNYRQIIAGAILFQLLEKAKVIKEPEHFDFKNCVYFGRHFAYPSLVKIGHTSNLKKRVASLESENYNIEFEIVAIIISDEHAKLEKYLHIYFAYCRKQGEWFSEKPIFDFLSLIFDKSKRLTIGQIAL